MNFQTMHAIVYQDLKRSDLGEFFTNESHEQHNFEVLTNADARPISLIDGVLADGTAVDERGQAIIAWRFQGRNTVALPGFLATDNDVLIEGVSYVDYVEWQNPTESEFPGDDLILDGIVVRRFIDWSDVLAQVGSFPGRQVGADAGNLNVEDVLRR